MTKFINSEKSLVKLIALLKKNKKKISLAHGVFDVVHIGHIEYFTEAKQIADILIVSLTADKFVNKGLNRPYFKERVRAKFIESINQVDYVVLNNSHSAVNVINLIKPNFYVKGPDYKKTDGDTHGYLNLEIGAVKKNKGKIFFTSGIQHSSSKLINERLDFLTDKQKEYIEKIKNSNVNTSFQKEYSQTLKKIKKNKVLIIGEIIIDKYSHVKDLGKPSKESILATEFYKNEEFLGGAVPVVKNISQICPNITFVSIFNSKKIYSSIKKELNNKVKVKLFKTKNFVDIEKNRYINFNTQRKIFEVYKFINKEVFNTQLNSYLKSNIQKFDHVIVCDFGHGLFNSQIVKFLNKSKYISANIQTNAGNRGFNPFTKYKKLNFLSIDEPELRLGLVDKEKDIHFLLKKIENKYKNILLTQGERGLNFKAQNQKIFYFPALATNPKDTIGAGDAAFSFASCFVKNSKNKYLISMIAAIAGALKVNIIGHRDLVDINTVFKTLINLIKK
jgi:rfaE bifunctional protein nucleotidyltransferase chain/domain